jgi:mono/diheme cytochrome c family protein
LLILAGLVLAGLLQSRAWPAPAESSAVVSNSDVARLDYMLNCQGCHLPDGRGYPGRVPDLRRTLGALLAVPGGREYVQRVPGAATAALDDAQLAGVLNWMVAEFGAAAPGLRPFSAGEAGALRRTPLADVMRVRTELAARAGLPAAY